MQRSKLDVVSGLTLSIVMIMVGALTGSCTRSSSGVTQDAEAGTDSGIDAAAQSDGAVDDAATPSDAATQPDAATQTDAEVGPDAATGTCTISSECANGMFCDKTSCTATTGTCVQLQTSCPDTRNPVCGCDGVNYWNDCLRRQRSIALDHQGVCTSTAAPCGGFGGLLCPGNNVDCAYLFPQQGVCQVSDPMGECWVTPPVCPTIMIGGTWRPCYGGPTTPCEQLCEATASGAIHWNDSTCPQ